MSVTEEGTAHSEYLFQRDKSLKDGYESSQKNYRIVPEMSKKSRSQADLDDKKVSFSTGDTRKTSSKAVTINDITIKDLTIDSDTNISFDDKRETGGQLEIYLTRQNERILLYPQAPTDEPTPCPACDCQSNDHSKIVTCVVLALMIGVGFVLFRMPRKTEINDTMSVISDRSRGI